MVQGLAFLSKKSWHVKNMANQEKVWMAEQQKEKEEQKTKELAQQIKLEREREEFDRISGKKRKGDRGIDWMYENGGVQAKIEDAEKEATEYLLGKEYTPKNGQVQGDFDQEDEKLGVNAVAARMPVSMESNELLPSQQGPTVQDKNEAFRMRLEDPMFQVAQSQRERQVDYEKKKALYERVVGPVVERSTEDIDDRKERKRAKKERKRERKEQKHMKKEARRHRRDRHEEDSYHDEKDRKRRRRSRSRSEEARNRRRRSPSTEYSDEHSPRRQRSRSPRRSNRASSSNPRGYESRRYHNHQGDERKRSSKDERRYHDDRRSRQNFDGDHQRKNRTYHEDDRRRDDVRDARREEAKTKKYGLIGSNDTKRPACDDLGPNRELLLRKRQEEERQREAQLHRSRRRHVSKEDRERALRDMQADAMRARKQSSHNNDPEERAPQGSAAFLHEMSQDMHGIRGDERSLSKRVQQNRHRNQNYDDSFM